MGSRCLARRFQTPCDSRGTISRSALPAINRSSRERNAGCGALDGPLVGTADLRIFLATVIVTPYV